MGLTAFFVGVMILLGGFIFGSSTAVTVGGIIAFVGAVIVVWQRLRI